MQVKLRKALYVKLRSWALFRKENGRIETGEDKTGESDSLNLFSIFIWCLLCNRHYVRLVDIFMTKIGKN